MDSGTPAGLAASHLSIALIAPSSRDANAARVRHPGRPPPAAGCEASGGRRGHQQPGAPRRLAGDKSRQTPHMVPAGGAATAAGVRVARGAAPAGPSPRGGVSYRRELGRLEASVKRTPLAGVGRASFIFNVRYTDGGSGASAAPDTLSDPPHARAAGAHRTAKRAPGGFPRRQRAIRRLFRRGTARWTRTDPVDRARAPEPARLPPAALPRTGQVNPVGCPFLSNSSEDSPCS